MSIFFVDQLKRDYDFSAVPIVGKAFHSICQRWLETFFPHVKQKTGKWIYHGYVWHAYSFNFEKALTQIRAFDEYQVKPIGPFFIFHESNDMLFDCTATAWPDLRELHDDICIFPHTMEWTFNTTHEMSIGLGPYFALSPT